MRVGDAFGSGGGAGGVKDYCRLARFDSGKRTGLRICAERRKPGTDAAVGPGLFRQRRQVGRAETHPRLRMLENIADLRRFQPGIDRHCDQTRFEQREEELYDFDRVPPVDGYAFAGR